ncbi:MAG: hypothetical protein OEZ01_06660 [Candidatus Heimdallarchaeota archaeon]|nr:hypothetical protein [Candidatus Heimdallarchaeota archaeon]MDH5645670.1 hypothetical protein [Candidatus Heimdallarchaeota archaeon]
MNIKKVIMIFLFYLLIWDLIFISFAGDEYSTDFLEKEFEHDIAKLHFTTNFTDPELSTESFLLEFTVFPEFKHNRESGISTFKIRYNLTTVDEKLYNHSESTPYIALKNTQLPVVTINGDQFDVEITKNETTPTFSEGSRKLIQFVDYIYTYKSDFKWLYEVEFQSNFTVQSFTRNVNVTQSLSDEVVFDTYDFGFSDISRHLKGLDFNPIFIILAMIYLAFFVPTIEKFASGRNPLFGGK